MKIFEILRLNETPLPDEWDKDVFTPKVSFVKQIKYATEMSKKLGAGSSRVAFIIEYQNRPTVLKIAKNGKGVAQNEIEIPILNDNYFNDITIPMIDYDTVNNQSIWLHTEKAEKMPRGWFKRTMGIDIKNFSAAINHLLNRPKSKYFQKPKLEMENDIVNKMAELCDAYDIIADDFGREANWGLYRGHPVLLDIGLSRDTYYTYYRPRG